MILAQLYTNLFSNTIHHSPVQTALLPKFLWIQRSIGSKSRIAHASGGTQRVVSVPQLWGDRTTRHHVVVYHVIYTLVEFTDGCRVHVGAVSPLFRVKLRYAVHATDAHLTDEARLPLSRLYRRILLCRDEHLKHPRSKEALTRAEVFDILGGCPYSVRVIS